MSMERVKPFVLFCIAGGLALAVDIAVLYALKPWLGRYGARVVSFLAAANFTWLFNRTLTFKVTTRANMGREYVAYLSSMLAGGVLNYAVYAAAVRWTSLAATHPAIGVALGSLAGLIFNYLAARRLYRSKS